MFSGTARFSHQVCQFFFIVSSVCLLVRVTMVDKNKAVVCFQLFFSVQGTCGSPMGPDPENRVDDQDTGRPGRPVSSGLQVPGEPGHCRARTRPPW